MEKIKYPFWDKYKLRVVKFKNGKAFTGEPKYPNGHLLGTLIGHIPVFNGNQSTTFNDELSQINKIVENKNPNERYPLIDEWGQICIYHDKSYLYDFSLKESSFLSSSPPPQKYP